MKAYKSSKPHQVRLTRFLKVFFLAGPLVLAGCATAPQSSKILLPDAFRQPCVGPATDGVLTIGDLAAFSLRQEAELQACEAKRAGIVDLVDKGQKPLKPWWKVW